VTKLSELYYFKDSEGTPKIVSNTDPLPIEDVNIGDKTDAAVTDPTATASAIALLKGMLLQLEMNIQSSVDKGTATGGSTTTLVDSTKSWAVDIWKGSLVLVQRGAIGYVAKVITNDATTLSFAAIGATVTAGDTYEIKLPIESSNISSINGTSLTSADWTLIFQSLNDITKTGLIKSIGDIGTDESIIARLGLKADTAVTDSTASASAIALLKGLIKILYDVWDDTNNRLGVKTIGVKDTDGTYGEATSFTLDGDGRPVQRIVDAAPFAYDAAGDTTKVTLQQVEGAINSAVPTKAAFIGGKYSSADPTYDDGDLTPVRTNSKGEILTQLTGSYVPIIYNVPMTNANTEYSQALPANVKKFVVMIQENDTAFRVAFVTGKVATPTAPYYALPSGASYNEDFVQGSIAALTVYFACGTAGKNIQIIAWA